MKNNKVASKHVAFDENGNDNNTVDYMFDNHMEPLSSAGFFGGVNKSNDIIFGAESSSRPRSPLYGLKSKAGNITKSPTQQESNNRRFTLKRSNQDDALDDSKTEVTMVEITEMNELDDDDDDDGDDKENLQNEKSGNNDTREDNQESGEWEGI